MLLQLFTGHETFPGASCRVTAFYRKVPNAEPEPVFMAARDAHSGCRQINAQSQDAGEGNRNFGSWIEGRYEVPPGSCIALWVQRRTQGAAFGFRSARAMLYMREHAALRRLRIALTGHANAVRSAGYVEGRFDIIPPVDFPDWAIDVEDPEQYMQPEWDEMISVSIAEEEISPLEVPKVTTTTTVTGKEVVFHRRRKKRNIRL
jgi:hypothetical protein